MNCTRLGIFLFLYTSTCIALPIGFGINQGDSIYNEMESSHFLLHHDQRTANEAAGILNTLEAGHPILEEWLRLKRNKKLKIISSALTSNASFANPVTDVIELQTLGNGSRDLYLHEYVHISMYKKFHNFLGPAGSILHLIWMPAWFIEGLAEALSISVGSDTMASIEKYFAQTNTWPSFAKLHSLYGKGNFFLQGYSLSGAFVTYLLRKKNDPKLLKKILDKFYQYTMPWYYPQAIWPFSNFLPMDQALLDIFGATSSQLYEEYKQSATNYWSSKPPGLNPLKVVSRRRLYEHVGRLISLDENLHMVFSENGRKRLYKVDFSKQGFHVKNTPTSYYLSNTSSSTAIAELSKNPQRLLGTRVSVDQTSNYKSDHLTILTNKEDIPLTYPTGAKISQVFVTQKKIIWMERKFESSRICSLPLDKVELHPNPDQLEEYLVCPFEAIHPNSLKILGSQNSPESSNRTQKLWIMFSEESLIGETANIETWEPDSGEVHILDYDGGGIPIKLARTQTSQWLLVAERNGRSLKEINSRGNCLNTASINGLPMNLASTGDDSLVLNFFHGDYQTLVSKPQSYYRHSKCKLSQSPSSPLTWAMSQTGIPPLAEALQQATYRDQSEDFLTNLQEEKINATALPLHQAPPPFGGIAISPQSSRQEKWRGRHIITVPSIGSGDLFGMQLGLISVPLMENKQNETVQASLFYGLASRYPSIAISLLSTRFKPTLSLSVFKQQKWNGSKYLPKEKTYQISYLDETGVQLSLSRKYHFHKKRLLLSMGLRLSDLDRYVGSFPAIEGFQIKPSASISYLHYFNDFSFRAGISIASAPGILNSNFDYHTLGVSSSLSYYENKLESQFTLATNYKETRGEKGKTPLLRGYYRPVKSYIQGSDASLSALSFPIVGGGKLFRIKYGDVSSYSSLDWTVPLIKDIKRMWYVFYLETLEFSAFLNYGGARDLHEKYFAHYQLSHGYQVDVILDNKGVRFNTGLGLGQVFGYLPDFYLRFGFDALF